MLDLKPVKYRVIDVTGVEEANRQDAAAQDNSALAVWWIIVIGTLELIGIAALVWVYKHGWRLM